MKMKEFTVKEWKYGQLKEYTGGNSQLLQDYRTALIEAYKLGNAIKELYGVIPPKVFFNDVYEKIDVDIVIGLTVN